MSFEDLPAELVKFVADKIDSVEHILILQILEGNSQRTWSISDLTKELRSADTSVTRRLEDFYQRGILSRPDKGEGHSFRPASDSMKKSAMLLLKTFRERPIRVIDLIYSRPPKAIQDFADSFVLRKGEK